MSDILVSHYPVVEYLVVDHPDFRFIGEQATNGFPYVVFERYLYNKPTADQVADYRDRQETVERLGGRMTIQEYQIAGETVRFTEAECREMIRAVDRVLPDGWITFDSWNGAGCRSFSVGIKPEYD